ncbi:hypothetical protein [Tabrizicola sp.]|uniref:hypothetical protein n=1 Tax=Tabrizicola sp. TaxID=2005166 RepID=UPI00286CB172|nr:hypothetical protein [Tabrizicola sp.]
MLGRSLGALLLSIPLPALANDAAVFVTFWANSGSLPPEYAWDVNVIITVDGQLSLKHCRGYETEGPACTTSTAKVDAAALGAIREAAITAQVFGNPAQETSDIPVGGGARGGSVAQGGEVAVLSAWPVEADAERVGAVLDAIYSAIPTELSTKFIEDN